MKKIESIDDERNGVITYEFENGQRARLDRRAVEEHGAAEVLRGMGLGHLIPTRRTVVIQNGLRIGTVPPDFDPSTVKSRSFLYDPRPGDFIRDGDRWIASNALGLGDLEAIVGFKPD